MTQEDKQLLLKDLCVRLPYGVICSIYRVDDWNVGWRDEKLSGYFYDGKAFEFYFGKTPISIDNDISKVRPYLRPMSSMTEEEKKFYIEISSHLCGEIAAKTMIDWLNAHHFDYHGLIDKGLAISVTEENNPYEN